MDIPWALGELDNFLSLTTLTRTGTAIEISSGRRRNQGPQSEIVAAASVVEQIFDRVICDWRICVSDAGNRRVNRWCQHRETAQRAKALILRQAELEEKLGDNAPKLNAAHLHPWVWEGARSLWQSGHYREAVAAASKKLNAETQNKVSRRDAAETDLFKQVFSLDPPQPGKARLRIVPNDGSKTYTSVHRGAMAFAEGCYAAIRNPTSHVQQTEMAEDHALEQLAAFSVLARWVDDALLER